jgi:carbonic anhydrase/acetyltransferase-like protein (isoleucine patch superfamily)
VTVPEGPDPFVAEGARVVGSVSLGDGASIWFNAVLRADGDQIRIGHHSNVQDGAVLHADPGFPVSIGAHVSIGHNAVVHGATVEDGCLVGMGSVVLNGARIGAGSLIGAGALVPEQTTIPPGSLVTGVPGRVRRALTAAERKDLLANAAAYERLAAAHRAPSEEPGQGAPR